MYSISFGTFMICVAIMAALIFVVYLYIQKERKKMMAFLEGVPQEVKDRLQNTEIKFIPTDPSAWIQEAIVINTQISGKDGNVKAAYFSKVNNKNIFDFTNIPTDPQVINERNIKTNDVIEIRLNNANEPTRLV